MNVWRPKKAIRAIAIGLAWRGDALLAAEVTDDEGRVIGVRPLGGSIEFGERREEALQREFREELCADIMIEPYWTVIENIYTHAGELGHEIVFAAPVRFLDESFYARDQFEIVESDASPWTARWFSPADLDLRGLKLFPDGLSEVLAR